MGDLPRPRSQAIEGTLNNSYMQQRRYTKFHFFDFFIGEREQDRCVGSLSYLLSHLLEQIRRAFRNAEQAPCFSKTYPSSRQKFSKLVFFFFRELLYLYMYRSHPTSSKADTRGNHKPIDPNCLFISTSSRKLQTRSWNTPSKHSSLIC